MNVGLDHSDTNRRERIGILFHEMEQAVFRRTDRLFMILLGVQWLAGIVLAFVVSPRTWSGPASQVHPHIYAAVLLGGLFTLPPMLLAGFASGRWFTRHAIAVGQMGFSALLIHLTGGRIETHFHVFGSLAFLACYRDWRVLVTGTVLVAGDHLVRGLWFPQSVYGIDLASPWRVLEHATWVVFEDSVLLWACWVSRREMNSICEQRLANEELTHGLEERVQQRTAELQTEVNNHRRTEGELSQREGQLVSMIENSGSVVIGLRPDHTIFEWNQEAARVFGRSHSAALGQDYFQLVLPPEQHGAVAADIRKVLAGTPTLNYENEVRSADGHRYTLLWNVARILDSRGKPTGIIAFGQDITERKQAERDLLKSKEAAEAGNRAKSEFLAVMSHEIRTPMNGVIGFANLLLETPLDAEQRGFSETIKGSGEALLTIINDILDFSKIEARKLAIEKLTFDIRDAVEEVVDLLSTQAEAKGIELVIRHAPAAPRSLCSDPGRFRQVLLNLLSNAIKFTPRGHVLVEIQHLPTDGRPEGGFLKFSVTDTGIGISPEKQALLFQEFTQIDASTTRKFGGTGLGLAIAKKLVELLGGAVGLTSAPGRGSTFWFTLPLPDEESATVVPAAGQAGETVDRAALQSARLLVVDDYEINRRVLHEQLKFWNLRHDCAASGQEALELLRAAHAAGDPYHVALLDYLMPEMDGAELGRQIKNDPALQPTLLILLTSGSQRAEAQRFLEAGFAAFLLKPVVRATQLLEVILRAWKSLGRPVSAGGPASLPPPEAPPQRGLTQTNPAPRKRAGRVLLAEDNKVNQQLAIRMLQKRGCTVDVVADGREAVQMCGQFNYDLIFMDCLMPEVDGYTATAEIRRSHPACGRHLPIIALTANALHGDRERCLAAGMDDYLSKPLRRDDLDQALDRWLPAAVERSEATASVPT